MTATVDPTSPADGGFGSLEHASRAYTWLFVPGNRLDRFGKAAASGADAVIIDLEDAVPAAEKVSARASVSGWLSPRHPVFVRVNAFDTQWFRDDVEICCRPGVAGVMLPKAE